MRQAVEAQVLHPLCDLGEHGLHQILTDAIEEARQSVNQGVDGAELLHSLLKASWMQPLLKVYECLQRYLRDSPAPALDYASGLSLQLLIDIRSSPGCSLEARELYGLLQQPHLQALLSAHDTVAQKDYDPVLPPMPEDLPDDEEATRLVCLVKNKQPLLCDCPTVRLLVPGASCVQSSRRDSLNCGTQHRLRRGGAFEVQRPTARSLDDTDPWWCSVRRGSYPQTEPPCCQSAAQPGPPPRYRPTSNCHLCCGVSRSQCTACYTKLLWEQSLNRSAPSVYSSGLIDGAKKGVDSGNDHEGATIKRSELTGEIFVARVIHGGLADRSGLLHAGDRILEVNGFPVDGMEPEQVIQVVQARSQGTVMFKVVPITERPVHNQTMLYVRAMADYSPQQDPTIPCADAGMSFRKGDVLEIVDQTDALWWQAKKLPCTEACAGLVPSTNLLKRKQREFWWSQPYQPHICTQTLSTVDEEDDLMAIDETCVEADEEAFESEELTEEEDDFDSNIEGIYLAGFRRSMRLCRRRSHSTTQPGSCHTRCPSSCYSALNCPYEEVVRYLRLPHDPHRLVALTGASGVGVNELRRNLIGMNPSIFQGATAHTTRAPKAYEEPGREYFFTSREIFDNMVYNNRFLEYGEHKGNLYGTSFESVMEVLNSGKICIIDIEPNAIQAVRTHELRAYIIYVKPPPLERLRETRQDSYITTNYCDSRLFKDEDFQEMEESARKIESQYWQLFDHVIVNDELQESCIQLLMAVRRAQEEPQWVPAAWIRPLTKA